MSLELLCKEIARDWKTISEAINQNLHQMDENPGSIAIEKNKQLPRQSSRRNNEINNRKFIQSAKSE